MMTFTQDKATVQVGRKFATVATEPAIRRQKDRVPILHFEARGKDRELIDCFAFGPRAEKAVHELNIGDEIIIDEKVEITAIDNQLEYRYSGNYII